MVVPGGQFLKHLRARDGSFTIRVAHNRKTLGWVMLPVKPEGVAVCGIKRNEDIRRINPRA
jgi:hypothetical protein